MKKRMMLVGLALTFSGATFAGANEAPYGYDAASAAECSAEFPVFETFEDGSSGCFREDTPGLKPWEPGEWEQIVLEEYGEELAKQHAQTSEKYVDEELAEIETTEEWGWGPADGPGRPEYEIGGPSEMETDPMVQDIIDELAYLDEQAEQHALISAKHMDETLAEIEANEARPSLPSAGV